MAFIAMILCLGLGSIFAKPTYRVFRNWQFERNANAAMEAMAQGQYLKARRLAMSVLIQQNDRYDMLVVLRQSMEKLEDPDAVNISRALMVHPSATEQDRIRGFRETCAHMPIALAEREWWALGEEKAGSPDYLEPFVERLIDQGLQLKAAKLLAKRADHDPQPALHFQAVRILLASGQMRNPDRAQFEISDIMYDGGPIALAAFRLLARIPARDFRSSYFPELETWIAKQQDATIDDHLLALIQRLQRFPERESEITKEAAERFAKKDPVAVANWLVSLGRADEALALMPAEEAAGKVEHFLSRADILMALGRWEQAREWLANPPAKIPLIDLHARRVVCESASGISNKSNAVWTDAMREIGSSRDVNDLFELHARMKAAGLEDQSREAMVAALRKGRGRLPSWVQVRDLLPWLIQRQQAQAMFEVCAIMARLEPAHPEIAVETLDLSCILGKINASVMLEKLENLKQHFPGITQAPRFQEAIATALLLEKKPGDAIDALGLANTKMEAVSNRAHAIQTVAKAMLGDQAACSLHLKRVNWDHMLHEEKDLFTRLLAKFSDLAITEPPGIRFDPKIMIPSIQPSYVLAAPEIQTPTAEELESQTDSKVDR